MPAESAVSYIWLCGRQDVGVRALKWGYRFVASVSRWPKLSKLSRRPRICAEAEEALSAIRLIVLALTQPDAHTAHEVHGSGNCALLHMRL